MKILHVITSLYIGGAEKLIIDIVPLLANKGNEVDVLLFDVTYTFLKKKIELAGVRVYCLAIGKNVYNPLFIYKLIFLLSKYDIVHSHNTACQYYVSLASLFVLVKPKLVTTEHNTVNRRRNLFLFKYVDFWMYNQYDAIISISDKTTKQLLSHVREIKNIHTINNGINLCIYETASQLEKKDVVNTDNSTFVIVMVGGFREQKDQDTVIKALALLPKKYVLWLVGNGKRQKDCINLAQELKVSDRVCFLGIREDIPNILKSSDVVVMSSHWEGFGLAAVEGMAVGKPVLASNVPGLAEVVGNSKLLFPKGDANQLARMILKLDTDAFFYQEAINYCIVRSKLYDINAMVNGYNIIYQNL